MPRVREPELMDAPDVDREALERGLQDLRHVNRWLLGSAVAVRLVWDLASRISARPLRVLDVGTGGGDVAMAIVRKARRSGVAVRILATDYHPGTLAFARRAAVGYPEIEVLCADALHLPLAGGACDIAMCTTMLHHLSNEEASRALEEMDRVSRCGVVVTDLARSRLGLAGARLLAATVWRRHPVTRHDGPASVRAAFTADELRGLAAGSTGAEVRVRGHPFFRISLVVDRTGGAPRPMLGKRPRFGVPGPRGVPVPPPDRPA